MSESIPTRLNSIQKWVLIVLRMVIGWHFLYEGLVKILNPGWSAIAYLSASKWIFKDLFHWMANTPSVLAVVDFLNMWGLFFIGLALLLGVLVRTASLAGISLLLLYYVANPPLIGLNLGMPTEGNYLVIDKNIVELIALILIAVLPTPRLIHASKVAQWFRSRIAGLRSKAPKPAPVEAPASNPDRRELLRSLAALPVGGAFLFAFAKKRSWDSWEEKHLLAAQNGTDAVTSATLKTFQFTSLKELKGKLPFGQIGDLKLSRMILGGNLIGGWAHARDLIYVSKLVKAYHHDQKVFDTLRLAEQCGINTLLTNPQLGRVINAYWRKEKGAIQFISDCGYKGDAIEGVKLSVDAGAHSCYVQGEIADRLARENKLEVIGEALELIRRNGMPAGIGAHHLITVQKCVDFGLNPDYWVKTLHRCDYWSAKPEEVHDNIWCVNPEETIAYMETLPQPWIAFKILAAGAIHPSEGFDFAFRGGADFICVGMYDFQIVDDVNMAWELFAKGIERNRAWCA